MGTAFLAPIATVGCGKRIIHFVVPAIRTNDDWLPTAFILFYETVKYWISVFNVCSLKLCFTDLPPQDMSEKYIKNILCNKSRTHQMLLCLFFNREGIECSTQPECIENMNCTDCIIGFFKASWCMKRIPFRSLCFVTEIIRKTTPLQNNCGMRQKLLTWPLDHELIMRL